MDRELFAPFTIFNENKSFYLGDNIQERRVDPRSVRTEDEGFAEGNDVVAMGMRTDVVSLLPMSMVVADMVPDNPGKWLFRCHVNDRLEAGMAALYTVTP